MKIPVLPVHHIPGNGVVLAFRLDNLQRFFHRFNAVTAIIRTRGERHRHDRAFLNLLDFLLLKIHHRNQVFDRVRPVVTVTHVEIADHFQQAVFLFQPILAVKKADGKRGGDHFLRIGNAALFQHGGKLRAFIDDLLHGIEVIQQHHAVRVFDRLPAEDLFVLQIHPAFDDAFAVKHNDIGLARRIHRRAVKHEVPDFGFFWLRQRNLGKAGIGFKIRRGFHDCYGLVDFISRQRV